MRAGLGAPREAAPHRSWEMKNKVAPLKAKIPSRRPGACGGTVACRSRPPLRSCGPPCARHLSLARPGQGHGGESRSLQRLPARDDPIRVPRAGKGGGGGRGLVPRAGAALRAAPAAASEVGGHGLVGQTAVPGKGWAVAAQGQTAIRTSEVSAPPRRKRRRKRKEKKKSNAGEEQNEKKTFSSGLRL